MRRFVVAGLLLCLSSLLASAGKPFAITRVAEGLYRASGPPREPCDFEKLRQAGIRTILDLRAYRPLASHDEAKMAAKYGIAYHNCRNPSLPWAVKEVERAYERLLRTEDYPLVVHCQQCRERAGLVVALYRVRQQGWSPQDASDEMIRCGMRGHYFWFYHHYFWENAYGPGKGAKKPCKTSRPGPR